MIDNYNDEEEITVQCSQCNDMIIERFMDEHNQLEHSSKPKCPFCNLEFNSINALQEHVDSSHDFEEESKSNQRQINEPIIP